VKAAPVSVGWTFLLVDGTDAEGIVGATGGGVGYNSISGPFSEVRTTSAKQKTKLQRCKEKKGCSVHAFRER